MTDRIPIATIVVTNYDGEQLLRPCMEALRAQEFDGGLFQTWVVDNGSKDGSAQLLEREYPEVRVIESKCNLGFAGGNNLALREITTPFAVLLNNDAVPHRNWLRNVLAPFSAEEGHRLGAVVPKVLFLPRFLPLTIHAAPFVNVSDPRYVGVRVLSVRVDDCEVMDDVRWGGAAYPKDTTEQSYRWTRPSGEILLPVPNHEGRFLTIELTLAAETSKDIVLRWHGNERVIAVDTTPRHVEIEVSPTALVDVINSAGSVVSTRGFAAERGFEVVDVGQFDRPQEVFAFAGNGVALRSEMLDSVGLFDDLFFLYYEDIDLSWRARAAGWSIVYEPKAVIRHRHAASSVEWSPLFSFYVTRNRLLMLMKNARGRVVVRAWLGYARQAARVALKRMWSWVSFGRNDGGRPVVSNVRVLVSLLGLLAVMLRRRWVIDRSRVVSRAKLERWLVWL